MESMLKCVEVEKTGGLQSLWHPWSPGPQRQKPAAQSGNRSRCIDEGSTVLPGEWSTPAGPLDLPRQRQGGRLPFPGKHRGSVWGDSEERDGRQWHSTSGAELHQCRWHPFSSEQHSKHRMTLGQIPSSEGVSIAIQKVCFLFILVPNVKQKVSGNKEFLKQLYFM